MKYVSISSVSLKTSACVHFSAFYCGTPPCKRLHCFNISILITTTEINIFENKLTLGEYIGYLVLGAVEVRIFSSDGSVYSFK